MSAHDPVCPWVMLHEPHTCSVHFRTDCADVSVGLPTWPSCAPPPLQSAPPGAVLPEGEVVLRTAKEGMEGLKEVLTAASRAVSLVPLIAHMLV